MTTVRNFHLAHLRNSETRKLTRLSKLAVATTAVPLVLVGCSTTKEGAELAASNADSEKTVTYEITGDSKTAAGTYVEGEGKPQEVIDVKTPWKKEVKIAPFSLAQITVGSTKPGDNVSCRILFDGKEVGTKEKNPDGDSCTAEAKDLK